MTSPVSRKGLSGLPPFDLGLLGSGVLVFIFSFLPWYGYKFSGVTIGGFHEAGGSYSISAWHSYSTLALLLLLAGTLVAAAAIFAPGSLPNLPVGARWIAAGLCSLGALLYLIRTFTLHSGDGFGVRWGGWLLLVVALANAASAVIGALSSDEQVPWAARSGGSAGSGGTAV